MERPIKALSASRDSLPLLSSFPSKLRKSSSASVSFAKEKKKNKIKSKEKKEESKLQAKRTASLASKLKMVSGRLEMRAQRADEEAERAKENLHLHFTTLEAALCRALREREAELAAQINSAADERCGSLLQLRAEAASLSRKLQIANQSDQELLEKAKRCHSVGKLQAGSRQRVEVVLDGSLARRLEQLLRTHGTVYNGT